MRLYRISLIVALHLGLPGIVRAQEATTVPANNPPTVSAADTEGEEVTTSAWTIVAIKGSATWDNAFRRLVESFKAVSGGLAKAGIVPSGPPLVIYTATDDTRFEFVAGYPVEEQPKQPLPPGLLVSQSPTGRALRFHHHGPYEAMEGTYDAITKQLDERRLESGNLFVEQYASDPLTTPSQNLVVEIFVPIKSRVGDLERSR